MTGLNASLRLSAAVVTLVLCGLGSITDGQQLPTDFAVRYEVGDCRAERFDSSTGAYVRLRFGDVRTATARIVLSDVQMQTIYKMIEDIGFFKYPAQVKAVPPDLRESITTHPSSTYRLEVRSGGVTHTVSWTDAHKPTTPEWDQSGTLRTLQDALRAERAIWCEVRSSGGKLRELGWSVFKTFKGVGQISLRRSPIFLRAR